MGWNYLSIPKRQRCNHWSSGMVCCARDYLSVSLQALQFVIYRKQIIYGHNICCYYFLCSIFSWENTPMFVMLCSLNSMDQPTKNTSGKVFLRFFLVPSSPFSHKTLHQDAAWAFWHIIGNWMVCSTASAGEFPAPKGQWCGKRFQVKTSSRSISLSLCVLICSGWNLFRVFVALFWTASKPDKYR